MEIKEFSLINGHNSYTQFQENLYHSGIPLPYFIPKTKENNYFYKNGLSRIIPRLTVKVHKNIEDCYDLWQKFASKKSMYDLWEYRHSWYQGFQFQAYFYTVYENKTPLAVLPLWYSTDEKEFEWFGGFWCEDNFPLVQDINLIKILFELAPSPLYLHGISVPDIINNNAIRNDLTKDPPKNIKEISRYSTLDALLSSLDKKNRYRLRSDFRNIAELSPRLEISDTKQLKNLDELITLNKKRFNGKTKEESMFRDERLKLCFRQLIKNSGSYKIKFIKSFIRNYLAAIDMIIEYKDTIYLFIGANDIHRFEGIGNFMLYTEFEYAFKNKFLVVDCLQDPEDPDKDRVTWKHRYFDTAPLYRMEK